MRLLLRRLAVLLVALALCEGVGFLVDWKWQLRDRLLSSLALATQQTPSEERLWADPEQPFRNPVRGSHALRFRLAGSSAPTAEWYPPSFFPAGRRAVVLGESAAFGVNVGSSETFAALLDARLGPRGTHVINAGQAGSSPWQVMVAGAQLLNEYAPTEMVLFTGNNPWVYWLPPQQSKGNPRVLRLLMRLATVSRAAAALEFLAFRETLSYARPTDRFHDHAELAGSRYALAHPLAVTPQFGPADWDPIKARYLRQFEASLRVLVAQTRARRARPLLVTMPFNYRLSPAWKHPQFEWYDPAHRDEVTRLLREAGRLVEDREFPQALAAADRALALDPRPPLLHYLRAQSLEGVGRPDEAEAAYARSREEMIGNLGSRLSVNEVIRRVAGELRVPLVDAAALFDAYEHARGRHFNEDLVLDDCHPSAAGHRIIADALAPLLETAAP